MERQVTQLDRQTRGCLFVVFIFLLIIIFMIILFSVSNY